MMDTMLLIFLFVMASLLGKELISKVPSQLHTPLMACTNAISGVTVVGALVMCAVNPVGSLGMILSFIAIILATINIVGGYMVTARMLAMFRVKEGQK